MYIYIFIFCLHYSSDHKLPPTLIATSICNLNTTKSREFVFNDTKSDIKE